MIYSEIVKNNVNNRDFDCNRLVVKLKWYKTTEFDFFCDKLFFNYDNYKISVMKFKNYIKVEIKSQDYAKASALYKHFTYIFELLKLLSTLSFGCPYRLFFPTLIIEHLGLISSINSLPLLVSDP